MRFKLFIISLTFFYGCVKCDKEFDDTNAWLNLFLVPNETKIDNRNTDLSPTGAGSKACVTEKKEQGICVKTTLCTKPEPPVDPTTQFVFRDTDPCSPLQSCCLQKNVVNKNVSQKVTNVHDKCGQTNIGANPFRETISLVGFAEYGEFPWMVALIRKDYENDDWDLKYAGGGALIHRSVVITAAHKVEDYEPSELKVRAGEWNSRSEAEEYPYQERDIKKIIVHENYFKLHAHNNVALLILKSPVILTDAPHIGIACLARDLPPPGTRCYGMGWGKSSVDNDKYADSLKKLELPLVEASACERKFKNTKLGSRYTLHRSLTCAGGEEGVDTCEGDGGSPLVCAPPGQSKRFEVVGLVTYGLNCGEKLPGAYLKIPEVYDWVGGRLTLEGLDKKSFVI